MALTLIAQIIQTTWTKAARGGRKASLRNAVPLAFPIPSSVDCFAIQSLNFGEQNGFVAPILQSLEERELASPLLYDWKSLRLQWDGRDMVASFRWSAWGAGAPKMISTWENEGGNEEGFQHDLLVPLDKWVRLRWMGRFSCMDSGQWWYEHTVANIAFMSSGVNPRLFIETTPSSEFRRLPILR